MRGVNRTVVPTLPLAINSVQLTPSMSGSTWYVRTLNTVVDRTSLTLTYETSCLRPPTMDLLLHVLLRSGLP